MNDGVTKQAGGLPPTQQLGDLRVPPPSARAPRSAIGPYRLGAILGAGGGGVVYRAVRADGDGAEVALKTVTIPRQSTLVGLRREIRALARLDHPGIVRIVGDGVDDGIPWMAMELLAGTSLRGVIEEQRAAEPPARVAASLALARRLCAPLGYLHGEGVVHRDLKPDNVLVRPDGSPVIVDFGLTAQDSPEVHRDTLDQSGEIAGTLPYMSPEQCRGRLVDPRTDLYALGCILYELLTGRPPFVTDALAAYVEMHLRRVPDPPSAHAAGVGADLDAVVLRLLAKDPRERYGYAADVARALQECGAPAEPLPGPPARPHLHRAGLAGREALVGRLKGCLDRRRGDEGGAVLLTGEGGAGKTRLLSELAALAHLAGAEVLVGAGVCGVPLSGLRAPLLALADRCRERGEGESARLFRLAGPILAPYQPALASLPGLALAGAPELPEEAARLRIALAVCDVLQTLAAATRVVLLVDDLQDADDLTLETLRHLVRPGSPAGPRILVAGAFRADEASPALAELQALPGSTCLEVGRLAGSALGQLVGDMLAMRPAPGSLVALVARQSGGNPLFAAEYLQVAVAEQLVVRDRHGRWRLAVSDVEAATLARPRSLDDLLGRRVARLPPRLRPLLEVVAVLATASPARAVDEPLAHLLLARTGEDAALGPGSMAELLQARILAPGANGTLDFSHDEIRAMVHEAIPAERRAALHLAAAVELSGSPRPDPAALGRHWEQGGRPELARASYRDAARELASRHASREAAALYLDALRLHGADAEAVTLREEIVARVLRPRGETARAMEIVLRGLDDARALGSPSLEGRMLLQLGGLHFDVDASEGRVHLEEAVRLLAACGDASGEGKALLLLSVLEENAGRAEEVLALLRRAQDCFEGPGPEPRDPGGLADACFRLAWRERAVGRMAEARASYEASLRHARAVGDRRREALAIAQLGQWHLDTGAMDEARALLEQAAATLEEIGDVRLSITPLGNLATLHLERGDFEEARRLNERVASLARAVGSQRWEGMALANVGLVEIQLGRHEEAREKLEASLRIARELGDRPYEATVMGNLAGLRLDMKEPVAAERLLRRALASVEEGGSAFSGAIMRINLGRALLAQGRLRAARSRFEQARSFMAAARDPGGEGTALLGLGAVARLQGRRDVARRETVAGLERLQASGDRSEIARAHCEMGHLALFLGEEPAPHLAAARQLVLELRVPADGPTSRDVARLERAIAIRDAGGELAGGMAPADAPPRPRPRAR